MNKKIIIFSCATDITQGSKGKRIEVGQRGSHDV